MLRRPVTVDDDELEEEATEEEDACFEDPFLDELPKWNRSRDDVRDEDSFFSPLSLRSVESVDELQRERRTRS